MPFDAACFEADVRLSQIDSVIQLIGVPQNWVKRRRRTGDGQFCVNGALVELNARKLQSVVLEAINQVSGKRYGSIEAFNDDVETSHVIVMRVLGCARANLIRQQADVSRAPEVAKPQKRVFNTAKRDHAISGEKARFSL